MQAIGKRIGKVGHWDHSHAVLRHLDHGLRQFLIAPTSVDSPQETDLNEQEFQIALTASAYGHVTNLWPEFGRWGSA
jgi:hypothetical protein